MKPIHLPESSTDEKIIIQESFEDLVYKPIWFDLENQNIRTIVDIGAHIGSFTLWALEMWPKTIIHSYEPDPESYDLLCKNVNEIKDNKVSTFKMAVWGGKSRINFT